MQEAETIRREMGRIRCKLHENVEGIVENARVMTDWRHYVRQFPWAAVGAAAAVGYLVVPSRVEVVRPDPDALARLAKAHRVLIKPEDDPQPHRSAASSAFNFLAGMLVRTAMGYLGQQASRYADGWMTRLGQTAGRT